MGENLQQICEIFVCWSNYSQFSGIRAPKTYFSYTSNRYGYISYSYENKTCVILCVITLLIQYHKMNFQPSLISPKVWNIIAHRMFSSKKRQFFFHTFSCEATHHVLLCVCNSGSQKSGRDVKFYVWVCWSTNMLPRRSLILKQNPYIQILQGLWLVQAECRAGF